ncbi:hypothetical protein A7K61_23255 [Pseudomonas sp. AP42]|nr:hypothetical protein A7K61_23255 [Pseudomonas sp. AP42]
MVSSTQVIANNVEMLLRYNQGEFLGKAPADYYLIEEDYASWELTTNESLLAYQRTIKVIALLKSIADVTQAKANTAGEAIFFATRKIIMPLHYDVKSLANVPSDAEISKLRDELFQEHHKAARPDIFKRVITRFFDQELESDRFPQFLRRFREIKLAYDADFDLYISGFSFDKVREEFEKKKLDFVVKVNGASSDIMNKLIAIPVGQGLLASQMKSDTALVAVNWALLAGSIIFAVIALMLLASQVNTLMQIKQELAHERETLKQRANPTYLQLKGMIAALDRRINLHSYWIPTTLIVLLLVTTIITVSTFNYFTPGAWAPLVTWFSSKVNWVTSFFDAIFARC